MVKSLLIISAFCSLLVAEAGAKEQVKALAQAQEMKTLRILVTSFEGFGLTKALGWDDNLSHDVALKLQEITGQIGPNVNLEVCRLPVAYDRAAEAALQCFQKASQKPQVVLSLGSPFQSNKCTRRQARRKNQS